MEIIPERMMEDKAVGFDLFIQEMSEKIFDILKENNLRRRKISVKELIEDLEKTILIQALSRFNSNQKQTAEFLGLKPTTAHEKIKKYAIRFEKIVKLP